MLDDAFWPALWEVAKKSGTRPEVLLTVWFAESGLDPRATNSIGCTGLNQSCPKPYGPGFPGDDAEAYRAAPASVQVAWIAHQVLEAVRLNGGPFQSAARYHQANFLPASLATAKRPGDAVAGRRGPYAFAYNANPGLDVNGDGVITLDDLGRGLELLVQKHGTPLEEAIVTAYARRPDDAPWDSAALAFYEPASPPSAGAGGIVVGVVLAVLVAALHARSV
jgi:hypothetical protein